MKQEFENNIEIIKTPVFSLHKFGDSENGTPIFIVPPFAGRSGNIAQNLIDKCVSHDQPVYAYELHSATQSTKNTSISDLVDILHTCQKEIGGPVELIGLCQGGWLSALFAAKHPESVIRFTSFATPFNTKTGTDNCIEKYMRNPDVITYQKIIVAMNDGIQPGMLQWLAFSLVDPIEIYISRWLKLWECIWDENEVNIKKWIKNNSWYDSPQNLAGNWFLDCLEHHFDKNELYEGKWIVGDDVVGLSNIKCPCVCFAGEDDEITGIDQVFGLKDKVTGPIECILLPGAGHTKAFVGTNELNIFEEKFF